MKRVAATVRSIGVLSLAVAILAATSAAGTPSASVRWQGIHGQVLYVNPASQIVIVVWSAQPHPTADAVIDDWLLCDAVAAALG